MTPARARGAGLRSPRAGEDTPLWRYVTYPVYLEFLRTKSLHFTRVDQLDRDDPHEGRFLLPSEWEEIARRRRREVPEPARSQFGVSCWCAADGERTSLWERYSTPFGVALRTTLGRLRRALRRHGDAVRVDAVVYEEDPSLVRDHGLDILRWMLRKRRAFEDEQEIRAVVWSLAAKGREPSDALPAGGVDLPVDPKALVEEVWVGPPWTPWFHEQVREVSALLGLPARRVRRSTLMDPPSLPGRERERDSVPRAPSRPGGGSGRLAALRRGRRRR
jgi:hypothetical protein